MRYCYFILSILLLLSLPFCSKENHPLVYGTVKDQGGCSTEAWLVEIENPDAATQSFICKPPPNASAIVACTHSVFIVNLPDNYKRPGQKIKFSKWNEVASCFSSTFAPHHIEAKNLSAN